MPDPAPAAYSLVPWVRRGLASLVTGTPAVNHASLPVTLVVNGAAVPAPQVRLLGPGDITSMDGRAVIRTDPPDGADSFEPNYLATVDLVLPDLPWLFTPSAPSGERLRPWICLVVVPDTDGVSIDVPRNGPAVLRLDSPLDPRTELPDLDRIDFWAHAQVTGDSLSGAALNAALDGDSAARLSRLIAPRKLEPARRYIACIVPTYRAGVNAGLGLPVDEHDLAPAWDATTTAPLLLPAYYRFRFQTGPGGDFASLARRITPPTSPLDVGARAMDASQPGFGAAPAPGVTLLLEGALRAANGQPAPWPSGAQAPYEQQLRNALTPPAAPDAVVAPPVYGRTQSGANLPPAAAPPLWLGDLNLDPRTRAAASAGAQVVQRDQEALVASAWDQLGEIRKANQLLRQAQLARQVSVSLDRRHLETVAGDGTYLQITAPVHSRVRFSDLTMRGAIAGSRLPARSVSGAMRKLARPRGPLGRRMQAAGAPQIVDRLNLPADQGARALTAAGPLQAPRGMVALDDVAPSIQVAKMTPAILRTIPGWVTSAVSATGGTVVAAPPAGATHAGAGAVTEVGGATVGGATTAALPLVDWNSDPDVPDLLKGVRANLPAPLVFPAEQTAFSQMQEQFRGAASAVGSYLNAAPPQFADPPPLGGSPTLAPARGQLRARLNPEETITARVRARIPVGSGPDPLQPLSGAPSFPQAMYSALDQLSSEWMLPGISKVPMDSAALIETNPRFVEAFLVGLNDELARELLWREFPAGLKATYFRNFWGGNGGAPDIPPIDAFDANGHLGDHTADHATGGSLVLLIRAELFRRYPSAVVSAVQAEWNTDGRTRRLGSVRRWPIFRGEIGADVTFFGFDVDDPRGLDDPAAGRPGWYFVIEEHATEPRFGLEPDASASPDGSWNDLSWNDVTLDRGYLNPGAAPATPVREGVTWGQSASAMAFVLMRRPARVALHGRALLAGEGA